MPAGLEQLIRTFNDAERAALVAFVEGLRAPSTATADELRADLYALGQKLEAGQLRALHDAAARLAGEG